MADTTETVDQPQQRPEKPPGRDEGESESSCPPSISMLYNIAEPKSLLALLSSGGAASRSSMRMSQIQLIYRAEGNANLVLALPQFKKVLRLPKTQPTEGSSGGSGKGSGSGSCANMQQEQQEPEGILLEKKEDTREFEWQQQLQTDANDPPLTMTHFAAYAECIRRLVGAEFMPTLDVVAMPDAEDREWINNIIRPFRPAHRRHKEFCGQFGLLLPDATQLPATFDALLTNLQAHTPQASGKCHGCSTGTASCPPNMEPLDTSVYAVEIKPKQGWLLPTDVDDLFDLVPAKTTITTRIGTEQTTIGIAKTPLSNESRRRHAARCRYCAMQYLKLRNGKIHELSEYCPLELFSGVHKRMLHSIGALLECPQNNLRIFRDGQLIYGDHAGSLSWPQLCQDIFNGDDKVELIKHLLLTCLLREYEESAAVPTKTMDETWTDETDIEARIETSFTQGMTTADTRPWHGTSASASTSAIPSSCSNVKDATERMGKKDGDDVEKAVIADGGGAGGGQPHSRNVSTVPQQTTPTMLVAAITTSPQASTAQQKRKVMKVVNAATKRTSFAAIAKETDGRTMTRTMVDALAAKDNAGSQISGAEMLPPLLPRNCVLQRILHLQLLAKDNLRCLLRQGAATWTIKSYNILAELLDSGSVKLSPRTAYLLGATALDCSVMVAFKEVVPSISRNCELKCDNHLVHFPELNGRTFLTKVTLLDLDPKPDSHSAKYVLQTRQAMNEIQR